MGRDLASLLVTMPEFRVGYLGRGLGQKRKMPFLLYDYPESARWGEAILPQVYKDFIGDDDGIIMTLDDISRRTWLVDPVGMPPDTKEFVGERNYNLWGYFPVDSTGPNGTQLTYDLQAALNGYNRVLSASAWGVSLMPQSRNNGNWLPHGIFTDKFYPRPDARSIVAQDKILVGCVMANQARKDYPVAIHTFALLAEKYGSKIDFWFHLDEEIRYWNIHGLLMDYGLRKRVMITSNLNDDQLAQLYSACACTILPSAGEGFGFPIAESMSCGTPCIVTDYAGGAELVPIPFRVRPAALRVDTMHNCIRAVLDPEGFCEAAMTQIEAKLVDWDRRSEDLCESVSHLDWNKLQIQWKKWLLEGIREN
jgi:glycosyltransferase involved in cell wall biosynthesis